MAMATVAHQYRGADTLHQVPDHTFSMRTPYAAALPNPPSSKPRAFPLTGPPKSRTLHATGPPTESASTFAFDATPEVQDFANATPPIPVNTRLAAMRPAPLFSSPPWSAQRSIDAAMKDTKPAFGAIENSSNTAKILASGSGSNTIDASLHVNLENRRSVCQSPSWEAYTQRKQEKKGAKKEKEQAAKQAKSKPRRLSKPPPPSPTLAPQLGRRTQSEQNISKTTASTQSIRDVSTTSLDFAPPPPIGSSSRKSRSRSSSFSSLFKSTFEIRRPSVDSTLDDSFIGGIKLEQHRIAAEEEQRKDEERQAKEDELGLHPALRSSKSDGRAGSAATGPPAKARSRYPPSTWRTSPSTASLISANSTPQVPEPSTIKKWRTRVGLKNKQEGTSTESPTIEQGTGPSERRTSSSSLTFPGRHSLDSARRYFQGSESATEFPALDDSLGHSPSPPPPEPPQKSPKRKSFVSMESPTSLKPTLERLEPADRNPNAYANVIARVAPRRASIDGGTADSIISDSRKRSFKEAARAAFGKSPKRPGLSALQSKQAGDRSASASASSPPQREYFHQRHASDSEGSLSDEYHSSGSATTNVTTPDISRPQSVRGLFSIAPKIGSTTAEKKQVKGKRPETSPGPAAASRRATEDELDPIQAAAQKVKAAFPEENTKPKSLDRRAQSETSPQQDAPRLRHPTLKPADRHRTKLAPNLDFQDDDIRSPGVRELVLSKDQSSVAAPWPASYLEAARKAAPAAPVPRNKPAIFPSPSLSTVGGLAPPSPRSQTFSSAAGSVYSRGESPVRTSASSFSMYNSTPTATSEDGKEPLAKMFVECCGCRYYHDMPSKLYEAMSNPEGALGGPGEFAHQSVVSMTVRCPWCQHDMSTKCCAGLAAMVYVKERLH